MENKLIILCGISGSGKSTFATNYIKENPNILRINRDSIRLTLVGDLNGYYQRKNLNLIEREVTRLEEEMINHLGLSRWSIIIDNTNLKQSYIKNWITLNTIYIQNKNIIQFKLFDISLEDAQRRVARRENMQTFEDLGYMYKQYTQYQEIKKWLENNYKDQII